MYNDNPAKESAERGAVFLSEGCAPKKTNRVARGHQLGLGTKQPWPLKSSMSPESSKCHKFV